MALPPGTKVGPYEVVSLIGAGGMGEVYRARDTKLSRSVAIKVLPPFFGLDRDRLARFQREAQTLASLNHPHVATVYGLEEIGGEPAIAMELVEGPSLAERIASGPLPVDDALTIARQIAEGLDAAHKRGIVHRDLKPHNVKLTADGSVKLLDFGLAKREAIASSIESASEPPTITSPAMTAAGVLLGTATYMAPEQARGLNVDHRADIWALGCVLYEMLTGRRVFSGVDTMGVLAAILRSEPDWSLLPAETPASIRRLLSRCLQKSPDRRLDSARDAILEIDDALDPAARVVAPTAAARSVWRTVVPWTLAALSIGALVLNVTRPRAPASSGPTKLTISLPSALIDTGRPTIALSPDGTRITFVAQQGDTSVLFLRTVDGFDAQAIPGTEAATSPLFSPDGQWIAFYANGRLRKVSIRGGPPVVIGEMSDFMGASWSNDGTIIAAAPAADLLAFPDGGGEPTSILPASERARVDIQRTFPHVLPGGQALLFAMTKPHEFQGSIAVRDLKTGEERVLVPDATHPSYIDGWLVFARSGTLFAVRFDPRTLAMTGTPIPVLQGVMSNQATGATHYSVSSTGTLAYVAGPAAGGRFLATADRTGTTSNLTNQRQAYYYPRISPDGRRLAVTILEEGAYSLWTTDSLNGRPSRVAPDSAASVWSPDGKQLAFTSAREGGMNLAVMRVDDPAPPKVILEDKALKVPTSWTPDGASIVFTRVDPSASTGEDIYIVNADGSGARVLVKSPLNESAGVVSPDGKWLAFNAGSLVSSGIFVAPLSDPGRQTRVEVEPARMPVWSRKGSELFFLAGPRTNVLMSTTVSGAAGAPSLGKPRLLFEKMMGGGIGFSLPRYDVSPDGQRFVFATASDAASPTEIRLTLGWPTQLRELIGR